ncbi:DUF1297 domain-containing protein [Candidatus Micrarchaeota archaeon]|nr:DUF1297 domain-containing protein [Candidatus Micrarchaeota archaeon]
MKTVIATLGSHSALDVCEGAKQEGFSTIVVAQRGREKTYLGYYKTRKRGKKEIGVVDEVLLVDKFSQITEKKYVEFLKKRNAIFVPNRSFSVYVGYDAIENNFPIPIFGNKYLLRAEERNEKNNQYDLLERAGVNFAKSVKSPEKIDKLCVVKVNEAKRKYERAFFLCSSFEEYQEKSNKMLKEGRITAEDLKNARIEEFIIGSPFNFNFFYSPVYDELELLGIDMRKQTNIDGFLRMPVDVQTEALRRKQITNIEVGHVACTVRESLLEDVFEQTERFVETVKKYYPEGIIGPFALQGAIEEKDGKEQFTVFDVSFRIPGSPGTRFTPYSSYLFRENLSFGRRIAMEVKEAEKKKMIEKITN